MKKNRTKTRSVGDEEKSIEHKMCSVPQIQKEGLILKANGEPFKTRDAIVKVLKKYGYTRSGFSANNNPRYELTMQEIDRINELEKKRLVLTLPKIKGRKKQLVHS